MQVVLIELTVESPYPDILNLISLGRFMAATRPKEMITRAPHAEANARLLSLNAVKDHDFVQKPHKGMPLVQIAALVMVNVH